MVFIRYCLLVLVVLYGAQAWGSEPRSLTLAFMISSGEQRSAWQDIVDGFRAANPDIQVNNLVFGQEDYKQQFDQLLQQRHVDLAFWFAGDKLRELIAAGRLQSVDGLLTRGQWTQVEPNALRELQQVGHYWALPVSYYPWGLLYRRSVFARLGLREPADWMQFLAVLQRLKQAGVAPLGVGGKSGWPAAAWFDYLNMRLNGPGFHRSLLGARADCRDPRLTAVLDAWQRLLAAGMFLPNSAALEWDGVLPYLYHGRVGMVLSGSFALARVPTALRRDIGFFPFPDMGGSALRGEDAPLDVLVQPADSQHQDEARRFAGFLLTRQELLARYGDAVYQLLPFRHSPPPREPVMQQGRAWLASAPRLAFFFDRDAVPVLRDVALPAFRQFLMPPYDRQRLLDSLCAGMDSERRRSGG